ncbi:MAG: AEC family transporter [Elainellaceae cyanobacterium]
MTETLLQAYFPLFAWTGLGVILCRFLPDSFPRLLGRGLYWVGVPLEILALTRRTQFSTQTGLVPLVTVTLLAIGFCFAWLSLQVIQWSVAREPAVVKSSLDDPVCFPDQMLQATALGWSDRSRQGAFLLSSILGNTGFVGLAIVPAFVSAPYLGWVVIYGVTHNLLGTYGFGVLISSYFSRQVPAGRWWLIVRDVLTVPSLWAFALGTVTHSFTLPTQLEAGLQASVWLVIPTALLLMGMRVSQLQGWKSLRLAIVPAVLKVVLLPSLTGLILTLIGITNDGRLTLVLMAGMPTAFAGLILAEEYELDRELISSSIVLTTVMLIIMIPLWLFLFKTSIAS